MSNPDQLDDLIDRTEALAHEWKRIGDENNFTEGQCAAMVLFALVGAVKSGEVAAECLYDLMESVAPATRRNLERLSAPTN
jgi:hypothetical protein